MDNTLYNDTIFVGIDITKLKFDVAVYLADEKKPYQCKYFENNAKGFEALMQWLQTFGKHFFVLMEATNIYHEELADFLYDKGLAVSIINPKRTANIAKVGNIRSKTDQVDAQMLAQFAYSSHRTLQLYQPRPQQERQLLRLMRQLEHLKTLLAQECGRIQMLVDAYCIASSKLVVDDMKKRIKELEQHIRAVVKQSHVLHENVRLLMSIPAIGEHCAWWLAAHLGNGRRFSNGKAAATFFGLTPMVRQSGSSVHSVMGISKIGHRDVRKVLYAPAMNFAFGCWANREYAGFVSRLLAGGKAKKVIIVALMRKLVTIAQSVLKHQRCFDPALLLGKS